MTTYGLRTNVAYLTAQADKGNGEPRCTQVFGDGTVCGAAFTTRTEWRRLWCRNGHPTTTQA